MSKYRYRDNAGTTFRSIQAIENHLHKVGQIKEVKGYVYKGRYNTTHVGVMVKGDRGSARFSGLSWGYFGTGPNGLRQLLSKLGLDNNTIADVAHYNVKWEPNKVGEFWNIKFKTDYSVELKQTKSVLR